MRRPSLSRLGLAIALALSCTHLMAGYPIRLVTSPAISPDGKSVAFSWRGDIWLVPSQGGTARRLTTHPATDRSPEFSPDGKRLAFVSTRTGSAQIFVMPVDGGEPQQWTFHSEGYDLQGWFPDGQSVLALGRRDHFWRHAERFFQVPARSRAGEKILFDGYGKDGHLSPDGKRLLFTREGTRYWRKGYRGSQASQIWLFDRNQGTFQQVAQHETGCRYPLWHPSGQSFYYVTAKSGSFNLWHKDLKTGKERQLTHFDDDSVLFPAISASGSHIVFRHLFDLYIYEAKSDKVRKIDIEYDGDEPRQAKLRRLLRQATEVAFSKDGLEIAFIAGGDVWVMDTELREPKPVTHTTEEERDLVFSNDGKALFFVSDRDGQADIWRAERSDPQRYWWQNDSFTLKRLTHDPVVEFALSVSPDGKHLGYCRERGDFWISDLDGNNARQIFASWNEPDYDWSPDGKWLAYAIYDSNFNRDVFVAPIDGSRPPYNISRHPDNDYAPAWSPDGRMIAFLGRRLGEETDIHYVFLRFQDEEQSQRDRTLKKAIEKMKKLRKSALPSPKPASGAKKNEPAKADAKAAAKKDVSKSPSNNSKSPTLPKVTIDFEGLAERVHRVPIQHTTESQLFWSPDSKKLAFQATIAGKSGTYTISPPTSLSPRLLTTYQGTQARWLAKGNLIVWLQGGLPASVTSSGSQTRYSFTARQTLDVSKRFKNAFLQCWRLMRDHYYDGTFNHKNWNAIYRKYAPMAAAAEDEQMLAEVVHLMLGELNGSHLGFFARSSRSTGLADDWTEVTAHLGVRFDASFQGPGLKVRDVIYGSPAHQHKTRIHPGEVILSIDGKPVDIDMDLTTVLNGRLDRDIVLQVRDSKGKERRVTLRPISFGTARSLLYEHWVRANRAHVDKQSKGRFGYVHIRGMNMSSFYRFEHELFQVAAGKEGLVIDVRENGGGFTTDHLLTILTQPLHAITVPRGGKPGYPQDRTVYATWHKPIVVLCNQNSFSNAEIFSHAIKTLKRGRLVGVPTAGGVISTGGRPIMDIGFLRMPFRGWFVLPTGEDMELNGAVPHFIIWPNPTEMPRGVDRQLDKALEVLTEDVQKWKARPQPKLKKASERRP